MSEIINALTNAPTPSTLEGLQEELRALHARQKALNQAILVLEAQTWVVVDHSFAPIDPQYEVETKVCGVKLAESYDRDDELEGVRVVKYGSGMSLDTVEVIRFGETGDYQGHKITPFKSRKECEDFLSK